MIVPNYWAEATAKYKTDKGPRTLRRFGWSNESQDDAQASAEQRARQAAEAALAGHSVLRREPKVPYNGADGLPIREEVIDRQGDAVLTRNSYGALCLNTPDVLFADIDANETGGCQFYIAVFVVSFVALLATAFRMGVERPFWMVAAASFLLAVVLGGAIHGLILKLQGSAKTHARKRLNRFVDGHPDWRMRLYETPNGWRVLVMHQTFDPRSDTVAEFFRFIGADPLYVRMCFNQNCFRARVSPKPWRIGMGKHISPRPGVWPIPPHRMQQRADWVADYDRIQGGFASCRFVEDLGNTHFAGGCVETERVRRWHDNLSQSDSELEIA
ncbi:hypothetical protein [Neorhodopirellula lusitana]|uniref:hypothetical protein n=1 Tax=Neorhodopirellula lusitana TaxID=445327 RepID=UPI00384E58C3